MSSLRHHLDAAAGGVHPPPDGTVAFVSPWSAPAGELSVVLSFTAHVVIATDLAVETLLDAGADGYGGALTPRVLELLAGPIGRPGVIDVSLVRTGPPPEGSRPLDRVRHRDDHPRVQLARRLRHDVEVYGDERGIVTLGTGFGDRLDLGIELEPDLQGRGIGPSLLADALATAAADGRPIWAGVSPGNARSLRAFLRCGFVPVGSEIQILRPHG